MNGTTLTPRRGVTRDVPRGDTAAAAPVHTHARAHATPLPLAHLQTHITRRCALRRRERTNAAVADGGLGSSAAAQVDNAILEHLGVVVVDVGDGPIVARHARNGRDKRRQRQADRNVTNCAGGPRRQAAAAHKNVNPGTGGEENERRIASASPSPSLRTARHSHHRIGRRNETTHKHTAALLPMKPGRGTQTLW